MRRRTFAFLFGALGLAACSSSPPSPPGLKLDSPRAELPNAPYNRDAGPVAILLPLSGKLADIGKPMLRAAQLALSVPGSPVLESKDTKGTAEGAEAAAQSAIEAGARMILGPLTSAETARIAPLARSARVPVLAFTTDRAQAQPGIWTLGITPEQQVRRLVAGILQTNHGPIAALLPDDDFGKAMADELARDVAEAGQPPPFIRMHGPGKDAIAAAVADLAATTTADQPPPFAALLLGATGNDLKILVAALKAAHVDEEPVQIMGPALWALPASGSQALVGAWFAAPDPAARAQLIKDYTARYKEAPPGLADLAHDAASIARVLGDHGQLNAAGLVQPAGFAGVDGRFNLLPDGHVRRALAIFKVTRQAPVKVADAPAVGS